MASEKTKNMPPTPTTVPIADTSTGGTTPAWVRWFTTLRSKVNIINEQLAAWAGIEIPTGITPGTYGDASHYPKITLDEHGWVTDVAEEQVAGTFTGLSDTPSSYTGKSGMVPAVNVAEDGLEFIEGGGSGIHIDNRVSTYANLPNPPTEGTGATYLVDADGLIYVWDGSAWPTEGDGISVSSDSDSWKPLTITDFAVSQHGGSGGSAIMSGNELVVTPDTTVSSSITLRYNASSVHAVRIIAKVPSVSADLTRYFDISLGDGNIVPSQNDGVSWWHTCLANGNGFFLNGSNFILWDMAGPGTIDTSAAPPSNLDTVYHEYTAEIGLGQFVGSLDERQYVSGLRRPSGHDLLISVGFHKPSGNGCTAHISGIYVK